MEARDEGTRQPRTGAASSTPPPPPKPARGECRSGRQRRARSAIGHGTGLWHPIILKQLRVRATFGPAFLIYHLGP
jgi:hypothetical protein